MSGKRTIGDAVKGFMSASHENSAFRLKRYSAAIPSNTHGNIREMAPTGVVGEKDSRGEGNPVKCRSATNATARQLISSQTVRIERCLMASANSTTT